jgi:hypothetical protein
MQVVELTGRGMNGDTFPLAALETSFKNPESIDTGHGAGIIQPHGGCAHGWFKKLLDIWYSDDAIISQIDKTHENYKDIRRVSLGQPYSPLMLEIQKNNGTVSRTEMLPPKIEFTDSAYQSFKTDNGLAICLHPKILQAQAVQHFRAIFDPEASDLLGLRHDYAYWMLTSFVALFNDSAEDFQEVLENLDPRISEFFVSSDSELNTQLQDLAYGENGFESVLSIMAKRKNAIIDSASQNYNEQKKSTDWQAVADEINNSQQLIMPLEVRQLLDLALQKMQELVTFDPKNPEDFKNLVLSEEEFLSFYQLQAS